LFDLKWSDLDLNAKILTVRGGGAKSGQKGVAHKKQIIDWLRANHPGLSDRAHNQIATIVNPNPKGGTP